MRPLVLQRAEPELDAGGRLALPFEAEAGREAIAALEAELVEERERRVAIEQRLSEQAAQLAALRDEIEIVRQGQPGAADPEPARAPDGARRSPRLVELPSECAEAGPQYWLRRREGFQVTVGSSPIGKVEEITVSEDPRGPQPRPRRDDRALFHTLARRFREEGGLLGPIDREAIG